MRKLITIFATVVFSVVCLSVSALAADGSCAKCGGPCENGVCVPCGNMLNECTCCTHADGWDWYLNEDGSLNHLVCHGCGAAFCYDECLSADEVFGVVAAQVPAYPDMVIHRGSYIYSNCPHIQESYDSAYFYIDKYGLLNLCTPNCDCMLSLAYFNELTVVVDENNFGTVAYELSDALAELGYRVDSSAGFVTTRCKCGWMDMSGDGVGLARVNGKHEHYCLDCMGVYTGIFAKGNYDYDCTGEDCVVCKGLDIETDIIPSDSVLSSAVPAEFLTGALGEVLGVLVVALPVIAGLFGIRKGIAFLVSRVRGV